MTKWISSKHYQGNKHNVYHSTQSCMYVSADSVPLDETSADAEDLRECDYCADRIQGQQSERKPCPYCGEQPEISLPDHLSCEKTP